MIEREKRRICALIKLDHPVFDCDGNYYMVNEDSLARTLCGRPFMMSVCRGRIVEKWRKSGIRVHETSYMDGPCYEYAACVAAAVAVIVAIL